MAKWFESQACNLKPRVQIQYMSLEVKQKASLSSTGVFFLYFFWVLIYSHDIFSLKCEDW